MLSKASTPAKPPSPSAEARTKKPPRLARRGWVSELHHGSRSARQCEGEGVGAGGSAWRERAHTCCNEWKQCCQRRAALMHPANTPQASNDRWAPERGAGGAWLPLQSLFAFYGGWDATPRLCSHHASQGIQRFRACAQQIARALSVWERVVRVC